MHRLITEGLRSLGSGMRLGSVKARHRGEYAELKAEAHGQDGLL
jgi:hypothetical protein